MKRRYPYTIALGLAGLGLLGLLRTRQIASGRSGTPQGFGLSYGFEHDLGKLYYLGNPVRTAIPIRNRAVSEMRVRFLRANWQRARAGFRPPILRAGEVGFMDIELDFEHRRGEACTEIEFATESGSFHSVAVRCEVCDCLSIPNLDDGVLRLVNPVPGDSQAQGMTLSWQGTARCSLSAACTLPFVRPTLREEQRDRVGLSLGIDLSAPSGSRYGRISILNAASLKELVSIPVMVYLDGSVKSVTATSSSRHGKEENTSKKSSATPAEERLLALLKIIDVSPQDTRLIEIVGSKDSSPEEKALAIRGLGIASTYEARLALSRIAGNPALTRAESEALGGTLRLLASRDSSWAIQQYFQSGGMERQRMLTSLAESNTAEGFSIVEREYYGEQESVRNSLLRSLSTVPQEHSIAFLRNLALNTSRNSEAALAVMALGSLRSEGSRQALREIAQSGSQASQDAAMMIASRQ